MTVKVGEMELTATGGFSPKVLSKTKQTPIAVKASGEVRMEDGSHPAVLRKVVVETDKSRAPRADRRDD